MLDLIAAPLWENQVHAAAFFVHAASQMAHASYSSRYTDISTELYFPHKLADRESEKVEESHRIMKIALLGGAGFIGTALTRTYLDAGHDVFVIDNLIYGTHQSIDARARFYHLDIRDERLYAILQQERPDIVSHHAVQQHYCVPGERALTDADVHIRGLLHILDSSVHAHVQKIIFASGGNTLYRPTASGASFSEETPLNPQSPLDISKAASEWYIRYYTQRYSLKHTILRYADVYAEHNTIQPLHLHHPLNYFLSLLAEQRRPIIRGTGDESRDHIFIDDVIYANLCALRYGENQTYHISSGKGHSLNQLYQMAAYCLGSPLEPIHLKSLREDGAEVSTLLEQARSPIEPVQESLHPLRTDAQAIILDPTHARQTLHWRPEVSLTEGIQRAAQQIKDHRFCNEPASIAAV